MKLALSLLCSTSLFAGAVHPDYFYQDYLDFANNKAKFKVGNSVKINSKNNNTLNINTPMLDFSPANQSGDLMSELTNIGGSYAITAAHMISPKIRPDLIVKGKELEFGLVSSKVVASDTDFKEYYHYDSNNEIKISSTIRDFAVVKMSKLNINKSAKLFKDNFYYKLDEVSENLKDDQLVIYQDKYFAHLDCKKNPSSSDCANYKKYLDKSQEIDNPNIGKSIIINDKERFSIFARSGAGIQRIGGLNNAEISKDINPSSDYNTGGFLYLNDTVSKERVGQLSFGDSSSKNNRGEFSNSISPGDSGSALYVYDNLDKKWYLIGVASSSNCNANNGEAYYCSISNYQLINHYIINDFITAHTQVLDKNSYNLDEITPLIVGEKDLKFNSKVNLDLKNANLNSSVLYFSDDSVLNADEIQLGGVVVDKSLEFNAKTKKGDNLHKMGKGVLNVNAISEGGLMAGEGEIVLKNDSSFSTIYLLNDAKLTLSSNNQLKNTNLLLNKAELNLNGTDYGTNRLQSSSFDTKITNQSSNVSTLELNQPSIFHGQILNNISLNTTNFNDKIIFDGQINAKELNVSNSGAVLQGHALEHKSLDDVSVARLKDLGYIVANRPTSATQNDWENRVNNINTININNSSLDILKHSSLNADLINVNSSSFNIGENYIYLDSFDGENIVNKNSNLIFSQEIKKANSKAENINVNAKVVLDHANMSVRNQANFSGSIEDKGDSTLLLDNANINASINVANLNAINSHFALSPKNTLISTKSTKGANNTYTILDENLNQDKYLIASLINTNNEISSSYLSFDNKYENISILKPNVEFKMENNKANWYLLTLNNDEDSDDGNKNNNTQPENKPDESVNDGNAEELQSYPQDKEKRKQYYFVEENKEAISQANSSLNQTFFSYVLEWNNLQKRMGELRNSDDFNAGVWTRFYHGKSSYLDTNKTKFYEFQAGIDKQTYLSNASLFTGLMLTSSLYNFSSSSLDGDIKGYGAGIYSSILFDNGFYLDAIVKYINYKNDFSLAVKNQNAILNTLKTNKNNYSLIASIEAGFRAYLDDDYYIEPEIELISGYVSEIDLKSDDKSLMLKSSSFTPLNLKASLFAGYNTEYMGFRAGVGLASDLARNSNKYIKDINVSSKISGSKDMRMFTNLSTYFKTSTTSTINIEFEKTFFGDLNVDYSLNLVYRFAFN